MPSTQPKHPISTNIAVPKHSARNSWTASMIVIFRYKVIYWSENN